MTMRYAHLAPGFGCRAVEALDMAINNVEKPMDYTLERGKLSLSSGGAGTR